MAEETRVGVILDSVFENHRGPAGHPERPERIGALRSGLGRWEHWDRVYRLEPSPAPEERILAVHSRQHWSRIATTQGAPLTSLDPDTYAGGDSFEVALLAAGAPLRLTEALLKGELQAGFALIRPPGHHAESRRAMGFCLFNNVAVAAQYALDEFRLDRVAVVDFDVHHGNGTQEIFYSRPDVLYISSHQHPLYPGTGWWDEVGEGRGEGYSVNFPVPAGRGNAFFHWLYQEVVARVLLEYRPQLVLVSAGYDAHHRDPLAGMALDEMGFRQLCLTLNEAARRCCEGRILYVLEGGYDLEALVGSVQESLSTLLEPAPAERPARAGPEEERYRLRLQEAYSRYWRFSD